MKNGIYTFTDSPEIYEAGGKGANLAKLSLGGFNVPRAFIVGTEIYHDFIKGHEKQISSLLEQKVTAAVKSQNIRDYLSELPFPEQYAIYIKEAINKLGSENQLAIRSSATAEDLPQASFAGQQDTYLNVKHQVLEKIKECFISLYSERAILYREEQNFPHNEVSISVVVQKMVNSRCSGIMFTADPVNGHRGKMSIESGFGLGEALVSGLINSDLFKVDKKSGKIVERKIGQKEFALFKAESEGIIKKTLSPKEASTRSLTPGELKELWKIGKAIEKYFGTPQDIEWAFEGETLYILQARPITSLFPLPEPQPEDSNEHLYVSLSHFQVMTDPIPPLAQSVLATLLPVGHENDRTEGIYFKFAAGRFYGDFTKLLSHPLGRRMVVKGFDKGDKLASLAIQEALKDRRFQNSGKKIKPLKLLKHMSPYIRKFFFALTQMDSSKESIRIQRIMDKNIRELQSSLHGCSTLEEKIQLSRTILLESLHLAYQWAPSVLAGMISQVLLEKIFGRKIEPQDFIALNKGVEGNVTTEMSLRLGDLADTIDSELHTYLQEIVKNKHVLPESSYIAGYEEFHKAWRAFLKDYGARVNSEIDISRPRWSEAPLPLLQIVLNTAEEHVKGFHRENHQKLSLEAGEAKDRILEKLSKGPGGRLRKRIARRLISNMRDFIPMREHHKYLIVRKMLLIKPHFQEAGELFYKQKRLSDPQQVWFLRLDELIDVLKDETRTMQDLIDERIHRFEGFEKQHPPRVISSTGEIFYGNIAGKNLPSEAIAGIGVSPGIYEGIARVVTDPSEEAVKPGDILVAKFTDPGWTALFVHASALISEVGGMMTHGALVAREYGIPAVVGIENVTNMIQSGDRIYIDGSKGYIIIKEKKNERSE